MFKLLFVATLFIITPSGVAAQLVSTKTNTASKADFNKYSEQKKELESAIALLRSPKYIEALPVLEKLFKSSNPIAGYFYASLLERGWGIPKNTSRANGIYKKVFPDIVLFAEKGDAIPQYILGLIYYEGSITEKDLALAVTWYRKSAEQGYAAGQHRLGLMYAKGEGIEKDTVEAAKWIRKAADQGYAHAQVDLGVLYVTGRGVEKSPSEAVVWFRKSADQGNSTAQYSLGKIYNEGEGVDKNYTEAIKWFRKSADQGFDIAQYALGGVYYYSEGVDKNYIEAAKWYRKAADHGLAEAQYMLGVSYYFGKGVKEDKTEAAKWYRKSADQGVVSAQYNIGLMYDNGEGVDKDTNEAVKWYSKAAEQGNTEAQKRLIDVKGKAGCLKMLSVFTEIENDLAAKMRIDGGILFAELSAKSRHLTGDEGECMIRTHMTTQDPWPDCAVAMEKPLESRNIIYLQLLFCHNQLTNQKLPPKRSEWESTF